MNINISLYFVASRTKYNYEEPQYDIVTGPFISLELAGVAKDEMQPDFEQRHSDWEDVRLVVLEAELDNRHVTERC